MISAPITYQGASMTVIGYYKRETPHRQFEPGEASDFDADRIVVGDTELDIGLFKEPHRRAIEQAACDWCDRYQGLVRQQEVENY
jgi:hypothetical protein